MTNETIDTAALAEEIATEIEVDLLGRPGKGVMLCLSGAQARALAALLRGVVDGPRVKPLEWRKNHGTGFTCFCAETSVGGFAYGTDRYGKCWHSNPLEITDHQTEDAARLAAEAQHAAMVQERARELGLLPAPPLSTTKEA